MSAASCGIAFAAALLACSPIAPPMPDPTPPPVTHGAWGAPELVTIQGYAGLTEDPYITSDEKYLLFDNAGEKGGPISLHYAKKVDYKTFIYVGEIQGIGAAGGAAPTIDTAGNLYFLSGRSHPRDFASIWHGTFVDGTVTNLAPVVSISKKQPDWMNMGASPSRDGKHLVFSDNGPRTPAASNLPSGVSRIVIATKNADGTFTRLANSDQIMKNVNTVRGMTDFSYVAFLSNDALEIFFTAPGGADATANPNNSVWTARRAGVTEPFGPAQPLNTGTGGGPLGIAEGSSISLDGKHLYYHKAFMSPTSATRTELYVLSR